MINKKITDAFTLEEYRAELASTKKYVELKTTYKKGLPELTDYNTPELWDELNKKADYSARNNPMAHDRLEIVANLIKNGKYKNILNIGLGEGSLEDRIIDTYIKDKKWYGLDISIETVRAMEKRFSNGIFKSGNMLKLPFNNNYFDCIVALEVFEHVKPSNIFQVFRQIKRTLKKNAILIVSVPLNEGLEVMIKKGNNLNAHLRVYTKDLITAELNLAGFDVYWEKCLYAFGKHYSLKTILCRHVIKGYRKPNLVIITAKKR